MKDDSMYHHDFPEEKEEIDPAVAKYMEKLKDDFLVTPVEMTDAAPPYSGSDIHNSMVTLIIESHELYPEDDKFSAPNGEAMTVNLVIERVRMSNDELKKLGIEKANPKFVEMGLVKAKPFVISMNQEEARDFKKNHDMVITDAIDKTPFLSNSSYHETQLPGRLSISRTVDKNGKFLSEKINTIHMREGLEHSLISGKDIIFAETSIQRGHKHGTMPGLTDFVSFKHKVWGKDTNFENGSLISKDTPSEIVFTTGGIPSHSVSNKNGEHVPFNLNDEKYMNDLKNLVKGSHNFRNQNENNPSPQIAYSMHFKK